MSLLNINTNSKSFKHLTERERYQIQILLKEKKEPKENSYSTRKTQANHRAGNSPRNSENG